MYNISIVISTDNLKSKSLVKYNLSLVSCTKDWLHVYVKNMTTLNVSYHIFGLKNNCPK